jgi:prevent-host-death family protein
MTKTYTFTEARQKLSTVLADADRDGEVRITHRSGKIFVIKPVKTGRSPLDVPGVDVGISADEICAVIREGRDRDYS